MSYSRWSLSEWYTFWSSPPSGTTENRDTATFEICGVANFTAEQLRNSLEFCLQQVKEVQDGDMEELKGYVALFLADVDKEYPIKNKE
jgi:hypothetical protein